MRRGQIRRRSLDDCWSGNPAGCLAGPVYIHPGIQGGPVSYSETFTILDCQTSVFVKVPDHVAVPVCVAVPSGMR